MFMWVARKEVWEDGKLTEEENEEQDNGNTPH